MKLDCVLTAVNENPLYLDFVQKKLFFQKLKRWYKL